MRINQNLFTIRILYVHAVFSSFLLNEVYSFHFLSMAWISYFFTLLTLYPFFLARLLLPHIFHKKFLLKVSTCHYYFLVILIFSHFKWIRDARNMHSIILDGPCLVLVFDYYLLSEFFFSIYSKHLVQSLDILKELHRRWICNEEIPKLNK
ncbi:hypothetical protein ACJX0J_012218, partial [Zea mays]